MSVIVTGMNMPETCGDCKASWVDMCACNCCCILAKDVNVKDKLSDCPLKSIDGLIKEIKDWQEDIHDNEYDADKHDFVFERIYEIIKEYCEVE